jgi:hypothetical protein
LETGEAVRYVMAQVHADPKVTLGIYAKTMLRRDREQARVRQLLYGDERHQLAPAPETGARDTPAATPERPGIPIESSVQGA